MYMATYLCVYGHARSCMFYIWHIGTAARTYIHGMYLHNLAYDGPTEFSAIAAGYLYGDHVHGMYPGNSTLCLAEGIIAILGNVYRSLDFPDR